MEPVASAVLRRPQSDLRTAPGFLSFSQVVEHMGHDGVQKMSARNFYRLLCKEKREKAIQGLALNLLHCRRNVKAWWSFFQFLQRNLRTTFKCLQDVIDPTTLLLYYSVTILQYQYITIILRLPLLYLSHTTISFYDCITISECCYITMLLCYHFLNYAITSLLYES